VSLSDSTPEPAADPSFDPVVVRAVLHHMNDDHTDDNLLIAQAFGNRSAVSCRMVHVDGLAGYWMVVGFSGGETPLRVAWTAPISQRAEIRREIVVLYERACAELGVTPRPHD